MTNASLKDANRSTFGEFRFELQGDFDSKIRKNIFPTILKNQELQQSLLKKSRNSKLQLLKIRNSVKPKNRKWQPYLNDTRYPARTIKIKCIRRRSVEITDSSDEEDGSSGEEISSCED